MTSFKNSGTAFSTWMAEIPGQVQITNIQIEWTMLCQDAIRAVYGQSDRKEKEKEKDQKGRKGKKDHWKQSKDRIDDYVNELPKLIKNSEHKHIRLRIVALIII